MVTRYVQADVTSSQYSRLNSDDNDWKCFRCNFTNSNSSLYHSYNVDVSNSFSVLAGASLDDSVFSASSLSPNLNPRAHSSPRLLNGNRSKHSSSNIRTSTHVYNTSTKSKRSAHSGSPLPNKASNMRYLSINCNGVSSKRAELENLVAYTSPDVLLLTETKIDSSVSTSEFLPVGYRGFRKDRNRSGGGVMVAVKDCFTTSEVPMSDVEGEVQWVKIDLKNNNPLFFGAFYRTPSEHTTRQLDELDKSLEHIKQLTRNNPNATIIVGGDFNAGDIDWDTNTVPSGSNQKTICTKLLEILNCHHLEQQQMDSPREKRILDLFCSNKPNLTKSVHVIPGLSDHEAVCTDCDIQARTHKKPPRKIHQWSKADWAKIKTDLCFYRDKFLEQCHSRSVEDNYADFKAQVNSLLDKYVPTKKASTRLNKPWLTGSLRRMCKKKRRLYVRARKSHRKSHWEHYKAFKKDTLKALRRQRWSYINDLLQVGLDKGDSRPLWGYLRSQRQDNMGVSPLKDGGILHSNSLS